MRLRSSNMTASFRMETYEPAVALISLHDAQKFFTKSPASCTAWGDWRNSTTLCVTGLGALPSERALLLPPRFRAEPGEARGGWGVVSPSTGSSWRTAGGAPVLSSARRNLKRCWRLVGVASITGCSPAGEQLPARFFLVDGSREEGSPPSSSEPLPPAPRLPAFVRLGSAWKRKDVSWSGSRKNRRGKRNVLPRGAARTPRCSCRAPPAPACSERSP